MGLMAAEHWQRIAAAPDPQVNLVEAALVIAAGEYQQLDIDGYLGRIEDLAVQFRRRLRQDIPPTEIIIALNHYFFDELNFSGNSVEFYDPRNSFLNDVIERKLGIPITLSILYIEIGRRAGLKLRGVSFPGSFLVKCSVRDGAIVLDPYAGGASLSIEDLRQRLRTLRNGTDIAPEVVKSMITAASNKEILARILRNLKGIYMNQDEMMKALSAVDRIIAVEPGAASEYRDRGRIYLKLECFRAALMDLRHYLQLEPRADDADVVKQQVSELQQVASRLN
ncbi:MAG: tetratricopeptide repeat protein [Burkholderiales bacterium]|nr:tetratricopeptide repeat protein [Burkholderiales bacterium]